MCELLQKDKQVIVPVGKEQSNHRTDFTRQALSPLQSLKAHLHDAIFAYDCCMQLADTIHATRIVPCR
jgi:nicotinamide mononucleotide adenylyltransferase